VSGVEDILDDGLNGWFIEQDAAQLGNRLLQLSEPLAARMGQAARQASLAFSWDKVISGYESCYAAAVNA
jgi:glycosyltransferase involved in cell wall biosynthesis